MIRSLIRQIILEDLQGFKSRTSGISYGRTDPKELPRSLKQAWAAEADHAFFDSLAKVHWIAGSPKNVFRVFEKMDALLRASRKDEISTMGYSMIDSISPSKWGEFGIIVQGRTTLAAKDMDAISSGYYREIDPEKIKAYSRTSGIPRRAEKFRPGSEELFILDAESFGRQYLGNELIVDNWRPVGLIAPLWFYRGLSRDVPLLGKRKLDPSYENLVRLFVMSDLPVYTPNGKPRDMTPYREMLEGK